MLRLTMSRHLVASPLTRAALAVLLVACASAGGPGGSPCFIDGDCNDSSLACVYESPDAMNGYCQAPPTRDAGSNRRDGGVPRADGGPALDGGSAQDGGTESDGGPLADGGSSRDGGVSRDGGTAVDGGTAADGGNAADGGLISDGGIASDGGISADGGNSVDGGIADGGAVVTLQETEPNDTRATANDLTARAFPFSVGGTVQTGDDIDYFRIRVTRGTLLRVSLTPDAGGALSAGFAVVGAEDGNIEYVRYGSSQRSGEAASRQVFLPTSGDYYIAVFDEATGGSGGAYVLSVTQEVIPAAVTATVGTPQSGTITGGAIKVYGVTPSAGPISATVVAKQLATPSHLDTIVTIWDPGTQSVVAEVNDGDTPTGARVYSSDARAAWLAAAGKLYHVIVDHFVIEKPGTNTAFRLDLTAVVAEGASTETNDRQSTSYPLTIAQTVYTARMRSSSTIDWDVYSVYLGPTDNVTVNITGGVTAGSEMLAYFAVIDEAGVTRRLGIVDSSFNTIATFYAGQAGTYWVYVTDYRYLVPGTAVGERPQDAAGNQYRIDIAAEAAPTVEVRGASPVSAGITTRGASRFYRIDHAGGVLWAKAVGATTDFSPGVGIWDASGASPGRPRTPLAGISPDVVAAGLPAGAYIIEVNELFGFTGNFTLTWQSLNVSSAANTLVGESDTTTLSTNNDTCATADLIGGVPGVAVGTLTAGDVDFYRFVATGPNVVVRTAAYGFESVDTAVQVLRPGQDGGAATQVAANDDENAAFNQYFSRVTATTVAGQTYCVRVGGKASTDTGTYALIVTPN